MQTHNEDTLNFWKDYYDMNNVTNILISSGYIGACLKNYKSKIGQHDMNDVKIHLWRRYTDAYLKIVSLGFNLPKRNVKTN